MRSHDGISHTGIGLALAEQLGRRLGGALDLSLSGVLLSATLHLGPGQG